MNAMALSFHVAHAFLIIGICFLLWMHFKQKAGTAALTMAAMVTIGSSLFVLRLFYYSCGDISVPESIIVSFMDIIRYFAMGKSFAEIDELPCDLYIAYYRLEIVLSLLAPLCTATALYALLQTISNRVRLFLNTNGPVCYFSELNERSLTLAKSLNKPDAASKNNQQKTKIIFCNVTGHSPLRAEAQALGAVTADDPIHLIHLPDATTRQVRIFLMDNNEDANLQTLLKMRDKLCVKNPRKKTTNSVRAESDFLVFSTQESAELVFNEVLANLDQDTLAYDLHLINETQLITQKLLLEHPLYEAADNLDQDRISVLVVGCGSLGAQIMKTAMICGLMDSYDFEIQVIDKHADLLTKQFDHDYPFLRHSNSVFKSRNDGSKSILVPTFHQADISTIELDRILKDHCTESNYIVVTTGDDQLNMNTAQFLRRWYARQALLNQGHTGAAPMIFAAVRNPERYEGLKTLEKTGGDANRFFLFGNNMEVYSNQYILERRLDTVAAMFNVCYDTVINHYDEWKLLDWNETSRRTAKERLLRMPVMLQLSNQMAALHSLYKIQDLIHWYAEEHPEDRRYPASLKELEKLGEKEAFFRLARLVRKRGSVLYDLEHRRWTLFHALNGWDLYPHSVLFQRLSDPEGKPPRKVHKDDSCRLHGCMIPTNQLDEFALRLEQYTGRKYNFVQNDRVICLSSIFAWLELRLEPKQAKALRNMLLNKANPWDRSEMATSMLVQLLQLEADFPDQIPLS